MKDTDVGNAELLVEHFGNELLYCPEMKSWYVWDGKRWVPDNGSVYQYAERVAEIWEKEAMGRADKEKKNLLKFASYCNSLNGLKSMIQIAQTDEEVQIGSAWFDRNPMLLNVDNGMIDLNTMGYMDFNTKEYITHKGDVTFVKGKRNHKWEEFLRDILPDADVRRFVQAAIGYSVTGLTGEDKVFILLGDGCNGKSTFTSTIVNLLGTYASQASSDLLIHKRYSGPRNDMFVLMGKRFVAATETGESCQLNENIVKQMTSGERVSVNPKYKSQIEFTPTWKTWLSTNHEPTIIGTDYAIRRRLILIPFSVQIPPDKIDVKLRTHLVNDYEGRSGILNWILDGVRMWEEDGLVLPKCVLDFTERYHEDQNLIGQFLTDRCVTDCDAVVAKNTLFSAYIEYCKQVKEKYRSKNAFGRYMRGEGFTEIRNSHNRYWVGLKLDERINILPD